MEETCITITILKVRSTSKKIYNSSKFEAKLQRDKAEEVYELKTEFA